MLEKYFDCSGYQLRTCEDVRYYPRAGEREKWEALPENIKEAYVKEAEKYIDYAWPSLLASNYIKLHTHNSRAYYDKPYMERRSVLSKLVIAECIEHKGRFIMDIINGIQLICEEMSWVVPAHNCSNYAVSWKNKEVFPMKNSRMLELFCGFTGHVMAWTYFLLRDELNAVSPIICNNLMDTMNERIFDPYLKNEDYWWLVFGNNWNTGMNNVIVRSAFLMLSERKKLRMILEKALWSVNNYFEQYPYDGGCSEGPGYWHANSGHAFLGWVDYISYGRIKAFDCEQIKNILSYKVNTYVGNNNYLPISDSHMNIGNEKLQDLYEIATMANDEKLKIMAAHKNHKFDGEVTVSEHLPEILDTLFNPVTKRFVEEYRNKELKFDKTFWYESIQLAIWREKDTMGGMYCAIKGGHNKELHNQNDVGHFTIFNDCEPIIIDPGMGEYSHKAFSDERYTVWFMNSKYHNVPYIGGIEQKDDDFNFGATILDRTEYSVTMDIAAAYNDDSIRHWIRSMKYNRDKAEYVLDEHYELTKEMDIDLHIMLPKEPVLEDGRIVLEGGFEILYSDMKATYEKVDLDDKLMEKYWGEVYRLKLSFIGKCGDVHYTIRRI